MYSSALDVWWADATVTTMAPVPRIDTAVYPHPDAPATLLLSQDSIDTNKYIFF